MHVHNLYCQSVNKLNIVQTYYIVMVTELKY